MGDVGVSVVVLQEKIGGTAKKKAPAVGGGGNGLRYVSPKFLEGGGRRERLVGIFNTSEKRCY